MNSFDAIKAVMEAQPDLSKGGFRTWDSIPSSCDAVRNPERYQRKLKREAEFLKEREEMTDDFSIGEFERAVDFLRAHGHPTKTIRKWRSSYGLKHMAENWHRVVFRSGAGGYISNGMFIAAAIHLGFQIEYKHREDRNCYFNIAKIKTKPRDQYMPLVIEAAPLPNPAATVIQPDHAA